MTTPGAAGEASAPPAAAPPLDAQQQKLCSSWQSYFGTASATSNLPVSLHKEVAARLARGLVHLDTFERAEMDAYELGVLIEASGLQALGHKLAFRKAFKALGAPPAAASASQQPYSSQAPLVAVPGWTAVPGSTLPMPFMLPLQPTAPPALGSSSPTLQLAASSPGAAPPAGGMASALGLPDPATAGVQRALMQGAPPQPPWEEHGPISELTLVGQGKGGKGGMKTCKKCSAMCGHPVFKKLSPVTGRGHNCDEFEARVNVYYRWLELTNQAAGGRSNGSSPHLATSAAFAPWVTSFAATVRGAAALAAPRPAPAAASAPSPSSAPAAVPAQPLGFREGTGMNGGATFTAVLQNEDYCGSADAAYAPVPLVALSPAAAQEGPAAKRQAVLPRTGSNDPHSGQQHSTAPTLI